MICPCKDCDHRTITCHSVCRDYQQWTEEHAKEVAQRRIETENRQLSRENARRFWKNLKRGRSIAQR